MFRTMVTAKPLPVRAPVAWPPWIPSAGWKAKARHNANDIMRAKNKRNTFALTQLKQRWQQQSATAAPAAAPRPASTAASAPHANPAARHPGAKHVEATQPEAKHPAAKHAKAKQPTSKPDPKVSRSGTRHKPKDTQQAHAPLSQEERQLDRKSTV